MIYFFRFLFLLYTLMNIPGKRMPGFFGAIFNCTLRLETPHKRNKTNFTFSFPSSGSEIVYVSVAT